MAVNYAQDGPGTAHLSCMGCGLEVALDAGAVDDHLMSDFVLLHRPCMVIVKQPDELPYLDLRML